MRAPAIFVVVRHTGEYSDAHLEPVAWFFDEDEANEAAEKLDGEPGDYKPTHTVEKVEAGL